MKSAAKSSRNATTVLGRVAQDRSPVEKDDLPELLRRRLFSSYPETEADKQQHVLAFWPRFEAMDPTRAKQPSRDEEAC